MPAVMAWVRAASTSGTVFMKSLNGVSKPFWVQAHRLLEIVALPYNKDFWHFPKMQTVRDVLAYDSFTCATNDVLAARTVSA
jgi:hypothetical protein